MKNDTPDGTAGFSRRDFMKCAGSLAAIPLVQNIGGVTRKCYASGTQKATELVLLGSAGGPSWWPDADQVSPSSALVVNGHIYLVDMGYGTLHRLHQAFNQGTFVFKPGGKVQKNYAGYMQNVKALFLTHLHMDHIADYPSLFLYGPGAGLTSYPDSETEKRLKIYGPGSRGQLEDVYPAYQDRVAPVMNPDNPTPGTKDLTESLFNGYAQTINNFTRDSGWGDFAKLANIYEIDVPPLPRSDYPLDQDTGKPLNAAPWPNMDPIFIYQDEQVSVSATLVNHGPVYPAFAFRFDTLDGSVVFSGDTGYPCNNLVRLAQGADILVHEVIDYDFIDMLFGSQDEANEALINHLKSAHTSIMDVGKHATSANAKTLVLNHIVPGNTPVERLGQAGRNFSGRLIVGRDLMRIGLKQNIG
jgi:ribonuclease BN (tRNA processing enzyme)